MSEKKAVNENVTELLEGITNDAILKTLTDTLIVVDEQAKGLQTKAELREAQLLDQLAHKKENGSVPADIWDLDEIENDAKTQETNDQLCRRIIAVGNVKRRPYENEPNYREAMAQYLTYITPILTDLEDAKLQAKSRAAEIRKRYERELTVFQNEYDQYNDKILELFITPELKGAYNTAVNWNNQFNRKTRADITASMLASKYQQPIVIQKYNAKPKITKHHSINGVQHVFNARPR